MTKQCRKEFAKTLFEERKDYKCSIPSREKSEKFVDETLQLLFAELSIKDYSSAQEIEKAIESTQQTLNEILTPFACRAPLSIEEITDNFCDTLADIHHLLKLDIAAIFSGDPAAESQAEIIVAYPGFFAVAVYRLAHHFYKLKVPVFPRMLTEYAHRLTGIDIHPGAEIGQSFCIDHGTGIVVGETAIIGNNVKLYQGVTLGALSVTKCPSEIKRHPTIESDVVVYSNATILGGDTVVGHGSVIGGNVWLTKSVPPFSTVYNKSEVAVRNTNPSMPLFKA